MRNEIYMVRLDHAPVTAAEVKRETGRDPIMSRVRDFILSGWPEEFDANDDLTPFVRKADEMTVDDGCVLPGCRVVVPEKFREK